jgi:hypothetical protein
MEPNEAADQIRELPEHEGGPAHPAEDRFRARVALAIAVLAMFLAITSLGGGNAAKDMMSCNIQASDTWAFFQAKNARQTTYKLTVEAMELQLQTQGDALKPEARKLIERKMADYRKTIARLESEPETGEGKVELKERAKEFEHERDRAMRQDPNFDLAEALLQIAIVLASVSILTLSQAVRNVALVTGGIAVLLMLNGFLLFVPLPF